MTGNSSPRRFKLGAFDAGAVARAEAALKSLSGNFDQWMRDEIVKLEVARERLATEGLNEQTGYNLYLRAHDLKGLGATYGYPLVTRLASSFCRLIHDADARKKAPRALVEAHIEAIITAVRRDIRTDADVAGRTLAEELEAQVSRISQAA